MLPQQNHIPNTETTWLYYIHQRHSSADKSGLLPLITRLHVFLMFKLERLVLNRSRSVLLRLSAVAREPLGWGTPGADMASDECHQKWCQSIKENDFDIFAVILVADSHHDMLGTVVHDIAVMPTNTTMHNAEMAQNMSKVTSRMTWRPGSTTCNQ